MMQFQRGRGRSLVLAAAAAAFAAGGAEAQNLPAASQVVERYVSAIGGRARLHAFQSRHQVAEMTVPGAGTLSVESFQARPNRIFTRIEVPGMGTMTTGYDGTTAWSDNPMQGPRLVTGAELPMILRQADFDGTTDPVGSFPTMETVGEREVGGHPCWELRMVHRSGSESRQCFDKTSGLLIGSVVRQATAMGEIEANVIFDSYQEFDGLRLPTRVVTSMAGQEMVMTVKSVSHAPIPAATFDLPPAIRALTTAH